jgi:transcription elongation factor Elf1
MEKIHVCKSIEYDFKCPTCKRSRNIYSTMGIEVGLAVRCGKCLNTFEIASIDDTTKSFDIKQALIELRDQTEEHGYIYWNKYKEDNTNEYAKGISEMCEISVRGIKILINELEE